MLRPGFRDLRTQNLCFWNGLCNYRSSVCTLNNAPENLTFFQTCYLANQRREETAEDACKDLQSLLPPITGQLDLIPDDIQDTVNTSTERIWKYRPTPTLWPGSRGLKTQKRSFWDGPCYCRSSISTLITRRRGEIRTKCLQIFEAPYTTPHRATLPNTRGYVSENHKKSATRRSDDAKSDPPQCRHRVSRL